MNKPRILVIDDEPGFTRMLKVFFHNYNIREENDALRAYATALVFRPDLILMDVVMPGIDGGNLAIQFREDATLKQVPIIFLTAVVSRSDAGESPKHFGGFPFLAKPVSPEVLERCIAANLRAA